MPQFVKKDINTWFAVDNIDLLEDIPTGQNTFHGTVIVINQQDEGGEPINPPLTIPEKLTSTGQMGIEVKYLEEPSIHKRPIRFQQYKLDGRKSCCDYHNVWALANFITSTQEADSSVEDENNEIMYQTGQLLKPLCV